MTSDAPELTDEEMRLYREVVAKVNEVERLRSTLRDHTKTLGQLRTSEWEIRQALCEGGPQYDYRPYVVSTPLADCVRRLIKERNDAQTQYERTKTLAQLAVGAEPGAAILGLVEELQKGIVEAHKHVDALSEELTFSNQDEDERGRIYAATRLRIEDREAFVEQQNVALREQRIVINDLRDKNSALLNALHSLEARIIELEASATTKESP